MAKTLLFLSLLVVGSVNGGPIVQKSGAAVTPLHLPGEAAQVSGKGSVLWALTNHNQMMSWDGSQWLTIPGLAYYISVDADQGAWRVGGNTQEQEIDYWVPAMGKWKNYPNTYDRIGIQGLASYSRAFAYYIPFEGYILNLTTTGVYGLQPPDQNTNLLSAGENGELWRIDKTSSVQRYVNGTWQKQDSYPSTSNPTYIDVQNASRVVATDDDYKAWLWDGDTWRQVIPAGSGDQTRCMQATINDDAIYYIDLDDLGVYKVLL